MRIEIVKSYVERGGTYWWTRLRARNGKILVTSETCATRHAARRAAALLRAAAGSRIVEIAADA